MTFSVTGEKSGFQLKRERALATQSNPQQDEYNPQKIEEKKKEEKNLETSGHMTRYAGRKPCTGWWQAHAHA